MTSKGIECTGSNSGGENVFEDKRTLLLLMCISSSFPLEGARYQ